MIPGSGRWVLALVLLATGVARGAEGKLQERVWEIDGVERRALLHVPAQSVGAAAVFVFHGHGGAMRGAARMFALHEHWPQAVVVYPQGLPTPGMTDPEGKRSGWQRSVGDQGNRDLKFFDAVLETLKQEHQVDEKRVFATGHSNGGQYTYLLWSARGDALAAVAPSAAALGRGFANMKPKPALHVAGEKDAIVPFALQERMMTAVRRLNGCQETGEPWGRSGQVAGTIYPSEKGTPFVSLIYPGTHAFPPEAGEMIARFFREEPGKIRERRSTGAK